MNDKRLRTVCALGGCAAGVGIVIILNLFLREGDWAKCLVDRDAANAHETIHWFCVQTFMWIAFGWAMGELLTRHLVTTRMRRELGYRLLPDYAPLATLEKRDMRKINEHLESSQADGILGRMIKLLTYQFQSTESIINCHACMNSQSDINADRCTSNYSTVRYITWLIPTLGFIGTVYGILAALGIAQSAPDIASKLPEVIAALSVAFWTTLLALVMCCAVMFVQHIVQGREEEFLAECYEYCLVHFINRLVETGGKEVTRGAAKPTEIARPPIHHQGY